MRLPKLKITALLAVALVMSALFLSVPSANAELVGGGGSQGGACTGTPPWDTCTTNGYGWEKFRVNGSDGSPYLFDDGTSWQSVVSACNSVGADIAWTFVILNGAGEHIVYAMGAGDKSSNDSGYDPVRAQYNEAASYGTKVAGTPDWGDSLAWFCYDSTPFDFNLTPTIDVAEKSVEGGSAVTLDPSVKNTGTTGSSDVDWEITVFKLESSDTMPVKSDSSTTSPTTYYGHSAKNEEKGSKKFVTGSSKITFTDPVIAGDYDVGDRVCYALSVKPFSHTDTSKVNWRHSAPDCLVISKKPKFQVLGDDLIVGKGGTSVVQTSYTTKFSGAVGTTYGSWGEYGIIATGQVFGMASAAGYSRGASTSALCSVSLLTFVNRTSTGTCTSSTKIGRYSMSKTLPDISSRLVASQALSSSTVNLATIGTGSYSYSGTAGITVTMPSGTEVAKGKWVVINAPSATVTISRNINYTDDALKTLTDIPQVVIIADQIRIDGAVTNIDAWLVASGATGSITTCDDVTAFTQLNATKCDKALVVNGPVMARHLYLYRTAGAGKAAQSGAPAETFNLRPDAYLWATGYSTSEGRLQTVSTKELPPRF